MQRPIKKIDFDNAVTIFPIGFFASFMFGLTAIGVITEALEKNDYIGAVVWLLIGFVLSAYFVFTTVGIIRGLLKGTLNKRNFIIETPLWRGARYKSLQQFIEGFSQNSKQ